MKKNLRRRLLSLILIVLMLVVAVGSTYAFIVHTWGGLKGTMAAVSGTMVVESSDEPVGVWLGRAIEPGTEYPITAEVTNTGSASAHIGVHMTWVWETDGGEQVPLPSDLVSVLSLEDEDGKWHWPVCRPPLDPDYPVWRGAVWERLPLPDASVEKDYLSPGESASVTVTLKTVELTGANEADFARIQEEKLYLRVKLHLEMVGSVFYRNQIGP
ncbi:MAG: hypothetical protein LBH86_02940 [Oscillospiraceae bacterium]|jgi:hypothetical protein|nr:hypothetical protein [Oscillospiraceae bacterium]